MAHTAPLQHYRESWPSEQLYSDLPSTLPPLPTTFSAPDYCTPRWFFDGDNRDTVFSGLGFWESSTRHHIVTSSVVSFLDSLFLACNPVGATEFSPGACLPGMTLAFVDEITVEVAPSQTSMWFNGACCNSDATMDTDANWCISTMTGTVTALSPIATEMADGPSTTLGAAAANEVFTEICIDRPRNRDGLFPNGTECQSITRVTDVVAQSYPLWIWWQNSDWSKFDQDYVTSVGSAMRLSIPGVDIGYQSAIMINHSTGLGAGAIAGIVIGSVATVAILILAVVLYLRYRQKSKAPQKGDDSALDDDSLEKDGTVMLPEAPGNGPSELPDMSNWHELPLEEPKGLSVDLGSPLSSTLVSTPATEDAKG